MRWMLLSLVTLVPADRHGDRQSSGKKEQNSKNNANLIFNIAGGKNPVPRWKQGKIHGKRSRFSGKTPQMQMSMQNSKRSKLIGRNFQVLKFSFTELHELPRLQQIGMPLYLHKQGRREKVFEGERHQIVESRYVHVRMSEYNAVFHRLHL